MVYSAGCAVERGCTAFQTHFNADFVDASDPGALGRQDEQVRRGMQGTRTRNTQI